MARCATTLLAALFAAAACRSQAAPAVEAASPPSRKADLPKEVASYVERRRGCNHWEGEDAYDAARGRDIAAAIKTLGCERLDAEERRLRKLYQAKPEIRKAIDDAKNEDG